jgi:hypothetical protein
MSESAEQKTIVAYFRTKYPQYAMSLRVSQSGGFRGKGREGAIRSRNVQSMGGVTGEADIAILLPRGGFGSLLIEHKAADGRYGATPMQLSYLEYHRLQGNCAVLTKGIEEAITAIDDYMAGDTGRVPAKDQTAKG